MRPPAILFDNREPGHGETNYQDWLSNHSDEGFVLTMLRRRPPDKMYLHRACCTMISRYTRTIKMGGYTEHDYIKVCAPEIEILRQWVRVNVRPDGRFTPHKCSCGAGSEALV